MRVVVLPESSSSADVPSSLVILWGLFLREFLVQQCEEPSFPWVVTYAISIYTPANIQGHQEYFGWPLSGHRCRKISGRCLHILYVLIRFFRVLRLISMPWCFIKTPEFPRTQSLCRNSGETDILRCHLSSPGLVVWIRHLFLVSEAVTWQIHQSLPPQGSLFCCQILYFAVRFLLLLWDSLLAVRFFILLWPCFCRDTFGPLLGYLLATDIILTCQM